MRADARGPGTGRTACTVSEMAAAAKPGAPSLLRRLLAGAFVVVVLGHWAEHVLQAAQIWWLGWSRVDAGGALGLAAPDLAHSEVLHVVYNLAILVGIAGLLSAFTGRARRWWAAALAAQSWHAIEHLLLWWQAATGGRPLGTAAPSSIVQLVVPRVELHLAYNTVVTVLLVTAVFAAGSVRLPTPRGPRRGHQATWPPWSTTRRRAATHRAPAPAGQTASLT